MTDRSTPDHLVEVVFAIALNEHRYSRMDGIRQVYVADEPPFIDGPYQGSLRAVTETVVEALRSLGRQEAGRILFGPDAPTVDPIPPISRDNSGMAGPDA